MNRKPKLMTQSHPIWDLLTFVALLTFLVLFGMHYEFTDEQIGRILAAVLGPTTGVLICKRVIRGAMGGGK